MNEVIFEEREDYLEEDHFEVEDDQFEEADGEYYEHDDMFDVDSALASAGWGSDEDYFHGGYEE